MKKVTEYELEQRYCEFLDELYGVCNIAGYEYQTSAALAEIDPTAFRCCFADWISSELENDTLVEDENGEYFEKE